MTPLLPLAPHIHSLLPNETFSVIAFSYMNILIPMTAHLLNSVLPLVPLSHHQLNPFNISYTIIGRFPSLSSSLSSIRTSIMDLLYYFRYIQNHLNKLFNTYLIIYLIIKQDCQPLQRTTKTTTTTAVTESYLPSCSIPGERQGMVKEETVQEANQTSIISTIRNVVSLAEESISTSIQMTRDMANKHVILLQGSNSMSLSAVQILRVAVEGKVLVI